jgi:hypothetical protein
VDDPVYLSRILSDVIALRHCFDLRWVLVFNAKDSGATRAAFFRHMFPWIAELRAFHPASHHFSHQRNVGVQYALMEIVPKAGTNGFFYFLDPDNTLPHLCDAMKESVDTSRLYYEEQLQCGRRMSEAPYEKQWRGNVSGQIECSMGAGSFLIPLTLLHSVQPTWSLANHRCGMDPTYFASLISAQRSSHGDFSISRWPQNFTIHHVDIEKGCVHAPWTQDVLNASLKEYTTLLRAMEHLRSGLEERKRCEQSHMTLHTHCYVLSAIRSALPHDRPVECLETGV